MSIALVMSSAETIQAAPAPAQDPPKVAPQVQSRPDEVSAAVSARAQGSKVEVESLNTETSTTWSNPDGTMTTEEHAAPIRFKDKTGHWRTIDLTWRKDRDGTIAPTGHPLDLKLGKKTAKAGTAFVGATSDAAREVQWVAPWTLPEPKLNGTRATYSDVEPGVDLVLHTRRSGFEYDFVVKTKQAKAPVWRIPLQVKGLTARPQPDGSIDFLDDKGLPHSTIPVPLMWDAVVDERSGEQVNRAKVDIAVETAADGATTLVVKPDPAWFTDAKRVFPITVDPTYALGSAKPSLDTWVQTDYSSDQSTSPELKLGTYNGGTVKARSFLNFPVAPFKGKQIISATLSMFETWSYSCTPSTFVVKSAQTASTASRWTAQPTIGSQYGSVSVAKGHDSGCPAGRMGVPITSLVQAWSTATYTVGGMVLMAANEADSNSWKRFHSTEGSAPPYISFTYNRAPAVAAKPTVVSAVAYAAPGGATYLYTTSRRPAVSSKGTDADGNNVRYEFEFHTSTAGTAATLKATCSSASYPSGTTAGCTPNADLPDNTAIVVRARTTDGFLKSGWSAWTLFRVATATPAAPVITCPYANGSWTDNPPAATFTCTISAPGNGFNAPGYVRVTVDGQLRPTNFSGGAPGQLKITPSADGNVAKATITMPNSAGLHTIKAQAESPAGKLSAAANYAFGYGPSTLSSPAANPRLTTTGGVKIAASGPPKGSSAAPTATVKWRLSGYGGNSESSGWNTSANAPLTVTDNGAAGVTVTGTWNSAAETQDGQLDADPNTAGIQPTPLNNRMPVLLDVQVCLAYSSTTQCTWSQTKSSVLRVPHAFGDGFPTADAGPGQVALWTGEFHTDATDVVVPGYTGSLSLSRSHSTFAGPTDAVNGVFGPGWTAQLEADGDVSGMRVVDSTRVDGTIALIDGDGTALVYESPTGVRRTTATLQAGKWVPTNQNTQLDGSTLTVAGSGAATTISLADEDGTTTTFVTTASTAPTATTAGQFRAADTAGDGGTKATYTYDTAGRVTRIIAAAAPGVTCLNAQNAYTGEVGCRSLRLEYGTTGRLVTAWLDIFNPAKAGGAGMDAVKVAAYTYDSAGRLATQTDPRSGLGTAYGYDAGNRITSVKPAGETPIQFAYTAAPDLKLANVKRDRPAGDPTGGTATPASFVYDVPTSGAGLPDLSEASVDRWNQASAPVKGFAIFGSDHPVNSTAPSGVGSGDWEYAELKFTDAQGYTVNTSRYGAGAWQFSATDYNAQGNVVRTLDERALRLIADGQLPSGATTDQLATITTYNQEVRNGDTVVTAAGTMITDAHGPARLAALRDGSVEWLRTHSRIEYDQGAPNGGIDPATSAAYRLETTETTWAHDPGTGTDVEPVVRTLKKYSPEAAGDRDGWASGEPNAVVTDVDLDGTVTSGDLVKITRYDDEGRVVETRQPNSGGSDAGTTRTVYYTAAANDGHSECGSRPQWAGLVCKTYPAAAPSSGPTLPTTTTTDFSYLLEPVTVVRTSGGVTHTTTNSYLADGRTASTATAVTGLAGSTPNTRKESEYDPASGALTKTTARNADGTVASTVTTGYDGWGRPTTYQPSGESTTTTTYDSAGVVASVTDANGSTRYTYDGSDAAGRTERRGYPTKVEVTKGGSTWSVTGAYDADGGLVTQQLPGGITQHTDLDHVGEPVGLRYTGQVTTRNEDGTTAVDPNGGWLAWSQDNDVVGRVVREWTPEGAAFAGPAADGDPDDVGDALPYDRRYSYDAAGRLTKVNDRTASTTGVDVTDPAEAPGCVTRSYQFDGNHNRLAKTTTPAAADGSCGTTGGTTTTRSFDTADRPVTGAGGQGAYAYDPLGRTLTLPASDAPRPQSGDVALGYFDNDLVKSIVQGGVTTTFTLDAMDRRAVETVTDANGSTQTFRHYTGTSDNPTWVEKGGTSRRYAALLGGDLSMAIDQDGQAGLTVANLHGDVVTAIDLTTGAAAANIDGWSQFDEYGNADTTSNTSSTGEVEYGWVGEKQRAVSGAGLLTMGVRLYNPATGLFTSVDPVEGGGANPYAYPTDPINVFDLDGRFWWFVVIAVVAVVRVVATVCVRLRSKCWAMAKWGARLIARFAKWAGPYLGALLKTIGRKIATFGKWVWRNKGKWAKRLAKWIWGPAIGVLGNVQSIISCVKGIYGRKAKWYAPWNKIWGCAAD